MHQGNITTRSLLWPTLLAAGVLILCGAHPVLAPLDGPSRLPASLRHGAEMRVVPVVVRANIDEVLRDSIVELAREQLGVPYVLGGASPGGFDCSGLVSWVLSHVQTPLPRTARQQAKVGVPVARSGLMPGDLLTFGRGTTASHVGIYLGDGQFIHASSVAGRVVVSRLDRRAIGRVIPLRGARRVLTSAGG